ncbi:hypothetical protein EPI10_021422 [Gossypium australe]|uniref:Uncharacterized protein n=1 Tax=Gossypium australe TaxID=47621 RepID=A0A5B6WJJ9_9ROSI|nr:hypothetical protein EPI10_021422 [Gossypium australe]
MWVTYQRDTKNSSSIFLYKDTLHSCPKAIQISVGFLFGSTTELFTDSWMSSSADRQTSSSFNPSLPPLSSISSRSRGWFRYDTEQITLDS